MWRVEQDRILADLEGFLTHELADASGFVPAYFEARFGPSRGTRADPPGSTARSLELDVGGETLRFTGFVDRIDLHPSGIARVIDYKSGRVRGVKDNLFGGGQSLQLPLYILAADTMLADNNRTARTTGAHYFYVTGRGEFRRVGFTRQALEDRRGEFAAILRTMVESIAAGAFPQNPGDKGANCQWCAFKSVCGNGREAVAGRKFDDRRLEKIRKMWEIA
jgi:ATP-dependent helicase/DNAse subunit B